MVERRNVKTGPQKRYSYVIEEGLKGDEWVVTNGVLKAIPGKPVTPERAHGAGLGGKTGQGDRQMISEFFVDRPIFANVIAFVTIIIGVVALYSLPVAQFPADRSANDTGHSTRYPGASAEVVAETIGVPIEQAVNGVEGAIYMSSVSGSDGSYTLTITFDVGTDLNTSLALVQNFVNSALSQTSGRRSAQGVTVRKVSPNILLVVSLYSDDDRFDEIFLSNYATHKSSKPAGPDPGRCPDKSFRRRALQHESMARPIQA